MRWFPQLPILLLCCCSSPPEPSPYGPRPVRELARFEVLAENGVVGEARLLEIEDGSRGGRFYLVKNDQGQWLGYIDLDGRVYQRVPFSMTEVFRGAHPMEKALSLLYEQDSPLRLVPLVEGAPAEATARRPDPSQPPEQR